MVNRAAASKRIRRNKLRKMNQPQAKSQAGKVRLAQILKDEADGKTGKAGDK